MSENTELGGKRFCIGCGKQRFVTMRSAETVASVGATRIAVWICASCTARKHSHDQRTRERWAKNFALATKKLAEEFASQQAEENALYEANDVARHEVQAKRDAANSAAREKRAKDEIEAEEKWKAEENRRTRLAVASGARRYAPVGIAVKKLEDLK